MKVDASVGRAPKNVSLHDHCGRLKLSAQCDDEAELLAQFYGCLVFGGVITIDRVDHQEFKYEIPVDATEVKS